MLLIVFADFFVRFLAVKCFFELLEFQWERKVLLSLLI
jgi:hypothetical protein